MKRGDECECARGSRNSDINAGNRRVINIDNTIRCKSVRVYRRIVVIGSSAIGYRSTLSLNTARGVCMVEGVIYKVSGL